MEPIQLLLIIAQIAIALVYLKLTRYRFGTVLFLATLLLFGVLAVYDPDSTTVIANYLGVERGADLLLYATVICFCGALVAIYGKFRKLDEQHTGVIRELALLRQILERNEDA
ncbi:hypothetical protein CLV84_0938 [Neolewinella xylanilytica]|uniref:DUF2304 domain-containing protein n=1 Tax=Neolewinella xylanilytica TaxID=1514080 RepID=A0A2S6I8Z8_9BACT|nr:DUF2304 domain-containing protein [Neolewinella xylanilytica]PPK87977.1 hypothetical protein CLV84_0938 [Neolewinella xylanilytica]